jgi:penicillin-binding protein 2A
MNRYPRFLLLFFTGLILIILFYTVATFVTFDSKELIFQAKSSNLDNSKMSNPGGLLTSGPIKNIPVNLKNVSPICLQAIVSTEDRTFYQNIGVDLNGILRTGVSIILGNQSQGGSTISQQLVKAALQNYYSNNPIDKYNEAIYSIKINATYEKSKVLEMYVNNVYWGNLNYGIESASWDYFMKSSSDLTIQECALLAGLLQLPEVYNPYKNNEVVLKRQMIVLQALKRDGFVY